MEPQAIAPKDYYIRDCNIELVLKQVETLLRKRNELFLKGRETKTSRKRINNRRRIHSHPQYKI